MRRVLTLVFALTVVLSAAPALADFFALEVDAQGGYTQLNKIERPNTADLETIGGFTAGVHGKIKILFISAVVDYQHFFKNADLLQLGAGVDFKLPLGVVKPYVRGSVGLMLLYAAKSAFDPEAETDFPTHAGIMGRAGVGLDIPLGDWFALGVVGDAGVHYVTQDLGFNFSIMGYFGLRI